jgi:D-alanyl-D-alanine carboxypeptidase (penicillin-binding protein 5/6)
MRRLSAARILIAALALLLAAMVSACSSAPGMSPSAAEGAAVHAAPASTARVPGIDALTGGQDAPGNLIVAGAPQGVKAKEGVLADAVTGQVLWDRAMNTELPMASITKVMTAYLVINAGGLNRQLAIPKAVLNYEAQYGAASDDMKPGEVLTVQELLYGLLIQSGADSAYTLATAYGPGINAFVAKMNATAQRLGMLHTHFTSPDGLPYPTETATYSTPADLLVLGQAAMRSAVFRAIVALRFYSLPKGGGHAAHWWHNDDALLSTYPGAVGIKTGYTDVALHCLLFEAVRNGRALIGVVMGSPATGPASAAQDAARVLTWGFGLRDKSQASATPSAATSAPAAASPGTAGPTTASPSATASR